MAEINLTKAVRQNLLTLQNTAAMMAKTQNKLATGNKVNSALDNPSNYFTASSLNSRASDLGNLMDSMASGIKTIEAADNGLTSITKTLESMQSTLRQSRQDKSFQTASYTLDNVTGAGKKLTFKGGAFGSNGEGSVKLTTDSAQAKDGSGAGAAGGLGGVTAAKASLTESAAVTTGTVNLDTATGLKTALGGKKLTLGYEGKSLDITIDGTGLVDTAAAANSTDLLAQINTAIGASADLKGKITATQDASKNIVLTASDKTDATITVGGDAGVAAALAGATPGAVAGSDGKTSFAVNGVEVNLNSGNLENKAWTDNDKNVASLVKEINVQLGNGGSKFKAVATGDTGKQSIKIQANSTSAGDLKITGDGSVSLFGAADATAGTAGAEDTSVNLAYSVDELVTMINDSKQSPVLAGKVKASNDNGKLRIQNLSTQDLDVSGVTSTGHVDGGAAKQTIDGNSVRTGFANQFNELRDQLDKLADDASFNGINLLRGDKLSITFNENGTSSIDISAKDDKSVDSSTLGVPTTIKAEELDSDSTIDGFLSKVKSALDKVRSQSSAFGSNLSVVQNRQDFTTNMMNTLQTGAGNLTLADMNGEAANMVALQTRQSLATSSLSMANQSDQNVLQLLR